MSFDQLELIEQQTTLTLQEIDSDFVRIREAASRISQHARKYVQNVQDLNQTVQVWKSFFNSFEDNGASVANVTLQEYQAVDEVLEEPITPRSSSPQELVENFIANENEENEPKDFNVLEAENVVSEKVNKNFENVNTPLINKCKAKIALDVALGTPQFSPMRREARIIISDNKDPNIDPPDSNYGLLDMNRNFNIDHLTQLPAYQDSYYSDNNNNNYANNNNDNNNINENVDYDHQNHTNNYNNNEYDINQNFDQNNDYANENPSHHYNCNPDQKYEDRYNPNRDDNYMNNSNDDDDRHNNHDYTDTGVYHNRANNDYDEDYETTNNYDDLYDNGNFRRTLNYEDKTFNYEDGNYEETQHSFSNGVGDVNLSGMSTPNNVPILRPVFSRGKREEEQNDFVTVRGSNATFQIPNERKGTSPVHPRSHTPPSQGFLENNCNDIEAVPFDLSIFPKYLSAGSSGAELTEVYNLFAQTPNEHKSTDYVLSNLPTLAPVHTELYLQQLVDKHVLSKTSSNGYILRQ